MWRSGGVEGDGGSEESLESRDMRGGGASMERGES